MVIFLRVKPLTDNPDDVLMGINFNKPLDPNWAKSRKADILKSLLGFQKGQPFLFALTEDDNKIKFIDTAINAKPPDKWEITIFQNDRALDITPPIDQNVHVLFDFGKLDFRPEPPKPPEIIEAEKELPPQPIPDEKLIKPPPKITVEQEVPRRVIDAPFEPIEEEIKKPEQVETTNLPFWAGWLKPVLKFFDQWFKSATADIKQATAESKGIRADILRATTTTQENVTDKLAPIGEFIKDPQSFIQKSITGLIKGVGENTDLIINEAEKEIIVTSITEDQFKSPEMKASVKRLRANMSGTPQSITEFLELIFIEPAKALFDAIETYLLPEPPVDFEKANDARKKLFALVIDFIILSSLLDAVATAVSITLIRNVAQYARSFIIMFNFGDLIALITKPSLDIAIKEPLERGFNQKFQTKKLNESQAINTVVKELEDVPQFIERMKELGFPESEAQLIWDGHFIAPVLQQILIAWRRGIIDEARVNELFILVDLDPRFNTIWETLKFDDPTFTQGRFMFETGAIDEDGVREIVKRTGLVPEFIENMTVFITRFQERLWRRRYLVTLARGYELNVIKENELREATKEAFYTEGVADWIVKNADARRRIAKARPKADKVKTLTRAQVLTALTEQRMEEDEARTRLEDMGYEDESTDIYIEEALLERELFLDKGVRQRTLTTALIIKALKVGKRDEAWAKERLLGLRYSEEDSNLIIELSEEVEEGE